MSTVCVLVSSVDIEDFADITRCEPEDLFYEGRLMGSFLVDENTLADPEVISLLKRRGIDYKLDFE
jgi:hypothetical protein